MRDRTVRDRTKYARGAGPNQVRPAGGPQRKRVSGWRPPGGMAEMSATRSASARNHWTTCVGTPPADHRGMAQPRIIVPGSTVAVSRRAVYRKAFLGDWDPRVADVWLYALADAQRVHHVAVHHAVRCVSHHHLEVTARDANLPEFLRRFHRDVSCALNKLLERERYDAPGQLFDGRPTHVMQLVDGAAQMRHLLYSRLNPVAAGLVDQPDRMPGRGLRFEDWLGDGVIVTRPDFYFGKDRPQELRLALTPPLRLLAAFDGDKRSLVYHLRRLIDDGVRAFRAGRQRPVVGADGLKAMHPWAEPKTLRERGGQRVPAFKVGVPGDEGKQLRARCAREVKAFRQAYRSARERRLDGEDIAYPHGTYGPRAYHNAPVEPEPAPGALLTLPGPRSLPEVTGDRGVPHRRALVDAVREQQREEIAEISQDLEARPDEDSFHRERPAPQTRHRFDDALPVDAGTPHPRRLTIERDERYARSGSGRGTGPPR